MAVSDVIRDGDRIEIKVEQQVKGKTEVKQYQSQVFDNKGDGVFEVAMPIIQGKLIVLPLNVRYEIVFNTQGGNTYKSMGIITERYKKDGFYMMELHLKKGLEKIQRREFYRHSCLMDFDFYILDERHKDLKSADEIYLELTEGDLMVPKCQGLAVDLSGGGMKFRSPYELDINGRIFIVLSLKKEKDFYVTANVVASRPVHTAAKVLYESRVSFELEDNRMREEIIRFIFEEERRNRKK